MDSHSSDRHDSREPLISTIRHDGRDDDFEDETPMIGRDEVDGVVDDFAEDILKNQTLSKLVKELIVDFFNSLKDHLLSKVTSFFIGNQTE